MDEAYNPDWRYVNMTQTEIEDHVKARSSQLISMGELYSWTSEKIGRDAAQTFIQLPLKSKKPPPKQKMTLWDEKVDRWVGWMLPVRHASTFHGAKISAFFYFATNMCDFY